MANLKDLIVNGSARVLGTLYADLSGNATTATTATKLGSATVGNTITPIYLNGGTPTALGYTIAKSVPADANFSNTTYTAGSGLSLSCTTINHASSITAGTVGTSTASSGNTLTVPYVTYNASGHVTATGTRTHTVTGFLTSSSTLDATKLSGTVPTSCYTNTTYTAGTGLSLSGTTMNHASSVTAGTAGTSTATSGSTLAIPYVTYNASGHITATGTHTHTVSGFLTGHQTIKNHGVTGATINTYADCSTAAATAAKTANITSGTFNLETGSRVFVKFANANTADTPTLNINSKGAKNIFNNGAQITTGGNKTLLKGVCEFIYDGTQYHLIGNYIDNNTTYSAGTGMSLSGTTFNHASSVTAGTVGTSTASSGSTLTVPYVTYNATGHITATGTRTHTVTGFLTGHQTIKINGVTGATSNNFGTCSTAAGTAEKAVTLTAGTFNLETGARVVVKFTVTNTAANPTLNVASKGAKPIYYRGSAISAGYLAANRTYEFVYNGTQFDLIGDLDTNTTYTHPTTSGNKHIPSGGSSGQFLKWSADGTAVWAADNNTTYSAGTGLSLSGTTFNHASSITAGTVGTSTASSGSTLTVPYITYNASGHITATGTRTHTVTGFQATSTAVTHTASTAVGNTLTPVYIASNGAATAITGIKVGMLVG